MPGRARKGGGGAGSGKGYNPYRSSDGKFDDGPRKARVAARAQLKDKMVALREKAKGASPVKKAELRGKFEKLKAKRDTLGGATPEDKARAASALKGKQKELKEKAKKATPEKKKELKKEFDDAKAKHDKLKENKFDHSPEAAQGRAKELYGITKQHGVHDENGRLSGLSAEGQKQVREHFSGLVDSYGLTRRPGRDDNKIDVIPDENMGGASGFRAHDGKITLSQSSARQMAFNAGDHAYKGEDHLGFSREIARSGYERGMDAHNTMVHETVHGYGPRLGYNNRARNHFTEEVSTEIIARHISGREHGMKGHEFFTGGYNETIKSAVDGVVNVSGASREKAFAAIVDSSISLKKQSGTLDESVAFSGLAKDTLRRLGVVDALSHGTLMKTWDKAGDEIVQQIDGIHSKAKL